MIADHTTVGDICGPTRAQSNVEPAPDGNTDRQTNIDTPPDTDTHRNYRSVANGYADNGASRGIASGPDRTRRPSRGSDTD